MSSTPDTLCDIVCAMHRPLSFAAKNDFAHLSTLKGLESLLPSLARRASALCSAAGMRSSMLGIAEQFETFYSLNPEKQRELISKSLKILHEFNNLDTKSDTQDQVKTPQTSIHLSLEQLARPVHDIAGVGPKTAQALARMNIHTIEDLLYCVPRSYIDRRSIVPINRISPGAQAVVIGRVHGTPRLASSGRLRILEIRISDGSAVLTAKWFRLAQRYAAMLKNKFSDGARIMAAGRVTRFGTRLEIHHPDIEVLDADEDADELLAITPVYPLTEGLAQKTVQRVMQTVAGRIPAIMAEYLPAHIRCELTLPGIQDALQHVHQPCADDNPDELSAAASPWHRRIVFDEFFMLQLVLALKKKGASLEAGLNLAIDDRELESLTAQLPFELTQAQHRALGEIRADMAASSPMHRLLQGDVGSGKTVVSLLAACIAVHNGYQAAVMAPTEILAEQHYSTIAALPLARSLNTALLTGSTPGPERRAILEQIRSGSTRLVIGTHALIQTSVAFNRLGLVIIDEQHKFGVMQRAECKKKGSNPDILVMTATPIPRTLGLTVYGDLDISLIDELPPGRTPVRTLLFNESRRSSVYTLVRTTVDAGNQVFIIYPLVEESEKLDLRAATHMAAHLQQDVFPEYRIGLLHGRMDGCDKDAVMRDFSAGSIHILVATTVVEVGIDVPNAALMIIEHAERFGLSQLHQLRGRVGRGAAESLCVLLAQFSRSDDARRRLEVMARTHNGFEIAEEDFAIRGPGEILGTRQSGLPDFRVAHIGRDVRILQQARTAAFKLIEADPQLEHPDNLALKKLLVARLKGRLELAGIG